jgi:hypothetical protein
VFFFYLTFLIAYFSCTGEFIVTVWYILKMCLGWVGPHCHSPSLSSSLLKMFSTVFIVLFSYKYINYINHIPFHTSFTHSIHPPLPTIIHTLMGPILHSSPSLFKYIFTFQRVFTMVFHPQICCTLISLSPLLLSLKLEDHWSHNWRHRNREFSWGGKIYLCRRVLRHMGTASMRSRPQVHIFIPDAVGPCTFHMDWLSWCAQSAHDWLMLHL